MNSPESEVSAIRSALYRGDRAAALELVRDGATPNVFDLAALGDVEGLRRELGADPATVGAWSADGFTPLHLAAYLGGSDVVALLLDAGADASAESANDMRVQPLHSAAALGDVTSCRLLIEAGVDPDARQAGDHTPLHEAALTGNAQLVDLLIAAGADPAARNADGRDSAAFAADNGHAEIAGQLRSGARE